MRIGILGTGMVGQALGNGFISRGHEVMMGSRDAHGEKVTAWATDSGGQAGTFADAAEFAEVAVLATGWTGTENAIRLAGPQRLAGKVVIDVTNPLDFSQGPPPRLALGHTDSGGEQVQRWLSDASVVKAFNIVGNAFYVDPSLPGGPPDMWICGNDEAAKHTVTDICASFGWPVIDIGGIEGARYLEPLAMLWITYGFRTGGWNHAFKLLRAP